MDQMTKFGERLALAMKAARVTGDDVGRALDVSKQAVTNWKKNRNFPKADQLYTLCRMLGIPTDYLIFDVAHPMSLEAIRIATRYDRLSPFQKTRWEQLLKVADATGPAEFGGESSDQQETTWLLKRKASSKRRKPGTGSSDPEVSS